jgi:NitT/TauT family transport system permease protein
MVAIARDAAAPQREKVFIDLSLGALPRYTLLSLTRGFIAYGLSLAFTLVCGTVAAHSRRAERVILPGLDVLQAVPVLGFLPGLVLAMVALFPTREIGLEIAAVVMMFTGQVWNMVFSFHGSLRGIPQEMRDVAAVHRLTGWRAFRLLELPAAMIGLVWNSMVSMAGGWFFLTVNEAFTLRGRDYRLPGIGSYMHEAIARGEVGAMVAGAGAMVVMIVAVDQLFWRPVVTWSERFRTDEAAQADRPQSWVLTLLRRSPLFARLCRTLRRSPVPSLRRLRAKRPASSVAAAPAGGRIGTPALRLVVSMLRWVILASAGVGTAWGVWSVQRLMRALPLHNPGTHDDWLGVMLALGASFLRTTAAVVVAALWALPVGVLIGRSPKWTRRLQPVVQVMASFPAPMLFPLVTMLLLALRVPFTAGCVALMLLGAQWYVLFNVIAGASAMPADLKEVADVYRMGRWQRWTRLYVPCVFPYLVTGLITAAGGAWNATIVAEYVELRGRTVTAFGLGSTISEATSQGNFPLLAASVVVMAVCVVVINRLFWKRLYRMAEDRYSLNT